MSIMRWSRSPTKWMNGNLIIYGAIIFLMGAGVGYSVSMPGTPLGAMLSFLVGGMFVAWLYRAAINVAAIVEDYEQAMTALLHELNAENHPNSSVALIVLSRDRLARLWLQSAVCVAGLEDKGLPSASGELDMPGGAIVRQTVSRLRRFAEAHDPAVRVAARAILSDIVRAEPTRSEGC